MKTIRLSVNKKNKNTGIKFISITENPANKAIATVFSDVEVKKQILAPIMSPNYPIKKKINGELVNTIFTQEDVDNALYLLNEMTGKLIDIEHTNNLLPCTLISIFQSSDLILVKGYEEYPLGTLYAVIQVDDDDLYNELKQNDFGLSIEVHSGIQEIPYYDVIESKFDSLYEIVNNKTLSMEELYEKIKLLV